MIDPDTIIRLRNILYRRQAGRCWNCGKPMDWSIMQCAHRIPQRKHWLARYGERIIHHPDNFRGTCPTDRCNNAASIGNNLHQAEKIAEAIETTIAKEGFT